MEQTSTPLASSFSEERIPEAHIVQAALAVRASSCLACHAQVKGNFYTDFGYGNSFFNNGSLKHDSFCSQYSEYSANEDKDPNHTPGSRYGITKKGWKTFESLQEGHLIVPQKTLTMRWDGEAFPNSKLKTIKEELWEKFKTSPAATTNAGLRSLAEDFIQEAKSLHIGAPTSEDLQLLTERPDARLVFSNSGRSHIRIFAIGPKSKISGLNFLVNSQDQGYMANYKIVNGRPQGVQPLECIGDIVILGGPVLLNGNTVGQNSLITNNMGCRLHVEKSVFINEQLNIQQSSGGTENLQISSALAIIMGLGAEAADYRLFNWEAGLRGGESCSTEEQSASGPIMNDVRTVSSRNQDAGPNHFCPVKFDSKDYCVTNPKYPNTGGPCLEGTHFVGLYDDNTFRIINPDNANREAPLNGWKIPITSGVEFRCQYPWGTPSLRYRTVNWPFDGEVFKGVPQSENAFKATRKVVNLEHIVLNAPQIHSRYLGKIKGLIIAEYALFAVGNFQFEHDAATFSTVPILPLIYPKILQVEQLQLQE